ncbi:hypothetical protein ACJX0J_008498, partial [Zea mays]
LPLAHNNCLFMKVKGIVEGRKIMGKVGNVYGIVPISIELSFQLFHAMYIAKHIFGL